MLYKMNLEGYFVNNDTANTINSLLGEYQEKLASKLFRPHGFKVDEFEEKQIVNNLAKIEKLRNSLNINEGVNNDL